MSLLCLNRRPAILTYSNQSTLPEIHEQQNKCPEPSLSEVIDISLTGTDLPVCQGRALRVSYRLQIENENIGKDTRRNMSLGLVCATYIHAYKHTNLFDNTGRIKRQLKS